MGALVPQILAVLIHAVSRIVLNPFIKNIQTSWVKMGPSGVKASLDAGANDLGGTLMNESITRAAEQLIVQSGRKPRQRDTVYRNADPLQKSKSFGNKLLVN